jgi:hypothetical protein
LKQSDLNLYYVHQLLAYLLHEEGHALMLSEVEEGDAEMEVNLFTQQTKHTFCE